MPTLLETQGAEFAETRRPATLQCVVKGFVEGLVAIPSVVGLGIVLFLVPAIGWFFGLLMVLGAPLLPIVTIGKRLNERTVKCPGCHFRYVMQRGEDGRCRVCLTRFVWINRDQVLAVPPRCC